MWMTVYHFWGFLKTDGIKYLDILVQNLVASARRLRFDHRYSSISIKILNNAEIVAANTKMCHWCQGPLQVSYLNHIDKLRSKLETVVYMYKPENIKEHEIVKMAKGLRPNLVSYNWKILWSSWRTLPNVNSRVKKKKKNSLERNKTIQCHYVYVQYIISQFWSWL